MLNSYWWISVSACADFYRYLATLWNPSTSSLPSCLRMPQSCPRAALCNTESPIQTILPFKILYGKWISYDFISSKGFNLMNVWLLLSHCFSKGDPRTTAQAPPRSLSEKQTLGCIPNLLTQHLLGKGLAAWVLTSLPGDSDSYWCLRTTVSGKLSTADSNGDCFSLLSLQTMKSRNTPNLESSLLPHYFWTFPSPLW